MSEKQKQLKSVKSVRWMKRQDTYGGKDLWKRYVCSLKWKTGVMDGESGEGRDDEVVCMRSGDSGEVPWKVNVCL